MIGFRQPLVLCGLLILSTGCASMFEGSSNRTPKKKKEGWSWFKKPEYQEPKSMVAIWTEDTLVQPGKPVTRGFGGRLYFYNEKSQAIPVEGELMVYGFDDTATALALNKPNPSASPSDQELAQAGKKFRFTSEQFTQHFSHSDLGASYSVWIPWDAVGGDQKKIMLMPTFITKDKRVVRGEPNKLTLTGKATALATKEPPNNTVQLASATIPTVESNTLPQLSASPTISNVDNSNPQVGVGLRTTTIKMDRPIHAGTQSFATSNGSSMSSSQSLYQQMQASLSQAQPTIAMATEQPAVNMPSPLSQSVLPPLGHHVPPTGWVQPAHSLGTPSLSLSGSQQNQSQTQGLPALPQIGHQPPSSLRP